MPTVDDLIISLRIDDTSNLGNLQKQLTALIGEKGDKQIDLGAGIDPTIKRDLTQIKADLMLLTPTVLTTKETVMRGAIALVNRMEVGKGLREKLLERYDMEEDRLDEFIEELLNISNENSKLNDDQQKGFVAEMEKFIISADREKGLRKTIVTSLIKMLDEVSILQQKFQDSLKAAGVGYRGQYQAYEITETTIDNKFDEQIKHYEGLQGTKFEELKKIFTDISDPLRAMEEAYKLMKMGVLDIEQLDKQTILDIAELKEILIAQIAASLEKSTFMLEDFYKAGKVLTGGERFGVGGPKKLDLVVKDGLKAFFEEHGGIVKFGELQTDETNSLIELKLVAVKDSIEKTVQERINQGFKTIRLVAEEVKDTAIDAARELLSKEIYKDIKIALIEILPRELQKSTGIAADLKEKGEEAKKNVEEVIKKNVEKIEEAEEEAKKIEEAEEEAKKKEVVIGEETSEEMERSSKREEKEGTLAALEDINKIGKNMKDLEGESTEEIKKVQLEEKRLLDEMMELMGKVEKTTSNTNKKLNGEKDEVEKNPTEF